MLGNHDESEVWAAEREDLEERRKVGQKPRGKKREEGNKKKIILGQRPLGDVSSMRMRAVTLKKKLHRKLPLGLRPLWT